MIYFKTLYKAELPTGWNAGERYEFSMRASGFIPLGRHSIFLEEISKDRLRIQSREKGIIVRRWDHLIGLEPAEEGTKYTDEVVVEAGWLTGPVAWWAKILYRQRQRRWQRLLSGKA
jgi:hypothetical protein